MEGLLVMSAKERERLKIFLRVKRGELQQKEAAALCRLDYRHLRRLYQRYCKQGDRGVVHQGRGQPSNRARSAAFQASVLARYQERYPDFGPTLAAEKLTLDGLEVDHEMNKQSGLSHRRLSPKQKGKNVKVSEIDSDTKLEGAWNSRSERARTQTVTIASRSRRSSINRPRGAR
jgi:hypothetical protein